jgi:hypothetical protein
MKLMAWVHRHMNELDQESLLIYAHELDQESLFIYDQELEFSR